MLARATRSQCSVWRPTTLPRGETVRGGEEGAKFSSACSSHNTAAKFKWNLFPSIQPGHTRWPEPDTHSRTLFIYLFIYVQPVHLETTHPSRTPHDFRGSWSTQPLLHGEGQKNALKLLRWCTKCPQEEPGFAHCVVLEPTVPKERQNSHFFFFFPKEGKSFSFPETGEEEEQPVQSSSKEQRNSPLTDPVLLNSNQWCHTSFPHVI